MKNGVDALKFLSQLYDYKGEKKSETGYQNKMKAINRTTEREALKRDIAC